MNNRSLDSSGPLPLHNLVFPSRTHQPIPREYWILVADDEAIQRDSLARLLEVDGYRVDLAVDGLEAMDKLRQNAYDLLLLDADMPGLHGFEVLERVKKDPATWDISVVMATGSDEMEGEAKCIELGADDYLIKPFHPLLLRARVAAALARKHWHDQEKQYIALLEQEEQRAERLLGSILPAAIIKRMKSGETTIADYHPDVSVLFADIVGFTPLASLYPPTQVVEILNRIFSQFDRLSSQFGLEKIKTIGDAYVVVGGLSGLPEAAPTCVARMALAMLEAIVQINESIGQKLQMRIGIHCGPVVAGVIGEQKFSFDLWGDTVNVASRMESQGSPGQVQITEAFRQQLDSSFSIEERGLLEVKGKGPTRTFWLGKQYGKES